MDKNIELLISKLDEQQMAIINKLNYDKSDFVDLIEKLEEYFQLHCLADNEGVTKEGIVCESILDIIGDM